jgi:hypothetical protein
MNKQKYSAKLLPHLLRNTCGVIGLGAGLMAASLTASAACTYSVDNEWSSGYIATITVKNDTNAAVNNWSVNWQYNTNRMTNGWNANFSGSNPYSATNMSWNGNIAAGQSVSFGFQVDKRGGSAERPSVNGALCGAAASSTPSSTPRSSVAPSSVARSSSSVATSVATSVRSSVASSTNTSVPANNFAQNGGVESGLTNWGTTAGTVTRSTADKRSGVASALITARPPGMV